MSHFVPLRFGTVYKVDLGDRKLDGRHISSQWDRYRPNVMQQLYVAAANADTAAGKESGMMDYAVLNGDYYIVSGEDNFRYLNPGKNEVIKGVASAFPLTRQEDEHLIFGLAPALALNLYLKFAKPEVQMLKPDDIHIPPEWFA